MNEQILPANIRDYLIAHIEEHTDHKQPKDVRFVWGNPGVGILSYRHGRDEHSLIVVGDAADAVHALEVGPADRAELLRELGFAQKEGWAS